MKIASPCPILRKETASPEGGAKAKKKIFAKIRSPIGAYLSMPKCYNGSMTPYSPQQFKFGTLDGISQKQLDVHIKLYEGYVKFLNTLEAVQADFMKDSEKNAYALGEVTRRIGFEFNGMRMHEYYFAQWESSSSPIAGTLADALSGQYGSMEAWKA